MRQFDKNFWIPYLILLLLFLIRVIPFFYPQSQTWGFNHLIFLPYGYSIIIFALAALALVLPFVKKTEIWSDTAAEWFSNSFLNSDRRLYYRFLFAACLTILFISFSTETFYLGDGYGYLKILGSDDLVLQRWTEIGASQLLSFIQSLIGSQNDNSALLAFQVVSYISGFFFILFLFLITKLISDFTITRLLTFSLTILSGILLLFFGYVEYYPLVWALMAVYLYLGLRFLKTGHGLLYIWLFQILGILYHLQFLIFIPGTLYITFAIGAGNRIYRSHNKIIWLVSAVLFFGLLSIALNKYFNDLYIQDIFLPLIYGKPIDSNYAIFSAKHIIDLLNEFLLIFPVLILLVFLGLRNFKIILANRAAMFLALLSICGLFFICVIDPKLALPRDWDLFSFTMFPILLLMLILLGESDIIKMRKFVLPMITLMLISTVPFLTVFLNFDRSLKYTEYIISLNPEKAYGSLVVLHEYYKNSANIEKRDALKIETNSKHIRIQQLNSAMNLMDAGNMELAENIIRSIKPDIFDGDYQRVWGRYYYMRGNYIKALEYLDRAVQLKKYNSLYRWQRAMIYVSLEKVEKAIEDLREAYCLDNSSKRVLDGLSYIHYSVKQYDSSIYYARELIGIDSNQLGAYYLLANSYFMSKDYSAAYQIAQDFMEKTEGTNIYNKQREQLDSMIELIGKSSNEL